MADAGDGGSSSSGRDSGDGGISSSSGSDAGSFGGSSSSGTDGGSLGGNASGGDGTTEGYEGTVEGTETTETELCTNEAEQELYDPGYDAKEYEQELMDFSYEADDPSSYKADTDVHYNSEGEPVYGAPVVCDESFIKPAENYNETGKFTIEVDWESQAINSDTDGFDKSCAKTTETLQPGTVISRYGSEVGRFGTDPGTEYSKLSLPYEESSQEYHEYRVIAPVSCEKGTAAKNFGQEGEGTQYKFSDTFAEMSNPNNPNRTLERIK